MYSFTCPVCSQLIFSPDEEKFDTCFNCGSVFSGKHGKSKRQKERLKKWSHFTIVFKEKSYKANTIDISANGLSIEIAGNPDIVIGETLDFFVGPEHIRSKVVRLERLPSKTVIGLEKLN